MNFAAKATEVDLVKLLYNVSLLYKQFKTRGHHCNQDNQAPITQFWN